MLDFAYGELNLNPAEFWNLTWGEFIRMQNGYIRRRKIESNSQGNILAAIYNTRPRKKGSKAYTADDFMPKSESDVKEYTDKERKEMSEKALANADRFNRGVVYQEYNG